MRALELQGLPLDHGEAHVELSYALFHGVRPTRKPLFDRIHLIEQPPNLSAHLIARVVDFAAQIPHLAAEVADIAAQIAPDPQHNE